MLVIPNLLCYYPTSFTEFLLETSYCSPLELVMNHQTGGSYQFVVWSNRCLALSSPASSSGRPLRGSCPFLFSPCAPSLLPASSLLQNISIVIVRCPPSAKALWLQSYIYFRVITTEEHSGTYSRVDVHGIALCFA